MENSTKVIIGLGVAAVGLLATSALITHCVEKSVMVTPTRDFEQRLLKNISVVYMAEHLKAYSGTGRTQPDAVIMGKVVDAELAAARQKYTMDFKAPRVAYSNGLVTLYGRTGATISVTIGPNY